MKVVCVRKWENHNLTIGKIYNVYDTMMNPRLEELYLVSDDCSDYKGRIYWSGLFRKLDDIREEKLNQVLG